jgi:hypothetical protein
MDFYEQIKQHKFYVHICRNRVFKQFNKTLKIISVICISSVQCPRLNTLLVKLTECSLLTPC